MLISLGRESKMSAVNNALELLLFADRDFNPVTVSKIIYQSSIAYRMLLRLTFSTCLKGYIYEGSIKLRGLKLLNYHVEK